MTRDWIAADWPAPPGVVAGTTLKNSSFELPGKPRWLKQVHGTRVVRWRDADRNTPEADALVATSQGACCVIKTADCLPVLFCATDGSEIAAAHAGWRGLAAGVIESTLDTMATPADRVLAWLGPAISQPAFEVGDEVRAAFCDVMPEARQAFVANDRGRWQADLYGLARQRLARAGVASIHGGGLCTAADPERFYSWRRDSDTGRLLSFVHKP